MVFEMSVPPSESQDKDRWPAGGTAPTEARSFEMTEC